MQSTARTTRLRHGTSEKIIVEVKEQINCLAHAMIIAIAKAEKYPNNVHNRRGYKIRPVVQNLLDTTGTTSLEVGASLNSSNSWNTLATIR
jgi:hypothetical protein